MRVGHGPSACLCTCGIQIDTTELLSFSLPLHQSLLFTLLHFPCLSILSFPAVRSRSLLSPFFSQIINVKPLQTEDPTLGIYLGLVKHYWLTLTHISNCPVGRQIAQEVGEGSVVSYRLNGVWSALVLSCWFSPQRSPNSAEEHGLGSKVMSQVKMQH